MLKKSKDTLKSLRLKIARLEETNLALADSAKMAENIYVSLYGRMEDLIDKLEKERSAGKQLMSKIAQQENIIKLYIDELSLIKQNKFINKLKRLFKKEN